MVDFVLYIVFPVSYVCARKINLVGSCQIGIFNGCVYAVNKHVGVHNLFACGNLNFRRAVFKGGYRFAVRTEFDNVRTFGYFVCNLQIGVCGRASDFYYVRSAYVKLNVLFRFHNRVNGYSAGADCCFAVFNGNYRSSDADYGYISFFVNLDNVIIFKYVRNIDFFNGRNRYGKFGLLFAVIERKGLFEVINVFEYSYFTGCNHFAVDLGVYVRIAHSCGSYKSFFVHVCDSAVGRFPYDGKVLDFGLDRKFELEIFTVFEVEFCFVERVRIEHGGGFNCYGAGKFLAVDYGFNRRRTFLDRRYKSCFRNGCNRVIGRRPGYAERLFGLGGNA